MRLICELSYLRDLATCKPFTRHLRLSSCVFSYSLAKIKLSRHSFTTIFFPFRVSQSTPPLHRQAPPLVHASAKIIHQISFRTYPGDGGRLRKMNSTDGLSFLVVNSSKLFRCSSSIQLDGCEAGRNKESMNVGLRLVKGTVVSGADSSRAIMISW